MDKKKNTITHLIKNVDLFGKKIEFMIDNNIRSKTVIGGFLTVFSLFLVLIYCIYLSQDFFYHKNPTIYSIENHNTIPLTIEDPLSKVPIMLSFRKDNSSFNVLDYFKLTSYYFKYSYLNNTIIDQKIINIETCSNDFLQELKELSHFEDNILLNSYCLNYSNLNEIPRLYGSTSSDSVGFIQVNLSYNHNLSISMDDLINQIYYYFIFLKITLVNSAIITGSFSKPLIHFPTSYEILLSPGFTKYVDVFLQKEILNSDEGFFFENIKKFESYSPEKNDFYFSVNLNQTFLVQFNLYSSNLSKDTKRIYVRIQTIFASIGGIINLFTQVFPLLVTFFSVIQRNTYILGKFIRISDHNTIKKTLSFRSFRYQRNNFDNSFQNLMGLKKKDNYASNIHNNTKYLPINYSNRNLDSFKYNNENFYNSNKNLKSFLNLNKFKSNPLIYIQKEYKRNNYLEETKNKKIISDKHKISSFLKKYKIKQKPNFSFRFIEIFKISFCPNNFLNKNLLTKKKVYYLSKVIVENYLDFINFIYKMEEINKIKYIIFNQGQLALFKFIPNQMTYIESNNNTNYNKTKLMDLMYVNDEEMGKIAVNYLKDMNENCGQKDCEIDQKLLYFLDFNNNISINYNN